jgi:hypothetical protein
MSCSIMEAQIGGTITPAAATTAFVLALSATSAITSDVFPIKFTNRRSD